MRGKVFFLDQKQKERLIGALKVALGGREEIVFAYLYGSFVGTAPFHDVDLGVYVKGIREEESTPYGLALSQELSEGIKIPIDVRVLNFASVLFLYHAIRGILVFERDEEVRVQVVQVTVRKYLDLKPMIHKGIKEAFG